MNVSIVTVKSQADIDTFIDAQWLFYKNDPNFVPPLKMDRKKLLNKKVNPFYKHAEMELFLAKRNGAIVGRIGAIVNWNHNKTHNDKVGFFGFFECENNQETADALLQAAGEFLKKHSMTQIRGPVNPSMNDETALLVEGFDSPPVVLMTYNPPYYANLIENAGMKKVQDLLAYRLHNEEYLSDKLRRMTDIVRERNNVTIRSVNFKNKEKFLKDVQTLKEIYNSAWQPNWGFVKMTDEEFDFLANDLKQIADPDFTIIAEIKGQPVGFALGLPDINQSLIYNKSGGLLSGIWHLLTKKKHITITRIIVLGVLPEYQKTGVDAVMYWELGDKARKKGRPYGEASWILEDNVMMNRALTTTMKGEVYKRYRLYQKTL